MLRLQNERSSSSLSLRGHHTQRGGCHCTVYTILHGWLFIAPTARHETPLCVFFSLRAPGVRQVTGAWLVGSTGAVLADAGLRVLPESSAKGAAGRGEQRQQLAALRAVRPHLLLTRPLRGAGAEDDVVGTEAQEAAAGDGGGVGGGRQDLALAERQRGGHAEQGPAAPGAECLRGGVGHPLHGLLPRHGGRHLQGRLRPRARCARGLRRVRQLRAGHARLEGNARPHADFVCSF